MVVPEQPTGAERTDERVRGSESTCREKHKQEEEVDSLTPRHLSLRDVKRSSRLSSNTQVTP